MKELIEWLNDKVVYIQELPISESGEAAKTLAEIRSRLSEEYDRIA